MSIKQSVLTAVGVNGCERQRSPQFGAINAMTVPQNERERLHARAAVAVPLAKRIIHDAEAEAARITAEAHQAALIIAKEAAQSGFDAGISRALANIGAASELERRAAAAVVNHALPILCEVLSQQFDLPLEIAAMEVAMRQALVTQRLSPPLTITVETNGAPIVERVLSEQRVTGGEVSVLLDERLRPGSCRIENSGGAIEIDIASRLAAFAQCLCSEDIVQSALKEDLVRCIESHKALTQ